MDNTPHLTQLADHLAQQRQAILTAWREVSMGDASQTTATALTRSQFEDHIPGLLDAWAVKLRAPALDKVDDKIQEQESKHGLQRWQQGYQLTELLREWGYLHLVLAREVAAFMAKQPNWPRELQSRANEALIQLVNEGIASSASEYAEMGRIEASGKANDLELALRELRSIEQRRSQLIHQAVHDIRGNVQSVSSVANLLTSDAIAQEERVEFANLLQQSVGATSAMLEGLVELARLEAGREHLMVAPFDARQVLVELCRMMQPQAESRQLYLKMEGQTLPPVEGDVVKVRRTLQNLMINALKYTERGGVTISWGTEPKHWWVKIQDTGPGLLGGPGAPIALGLREATAEALEVDIKAAAAAGREPTVLDQKDAGSTKPVRSHAHPGEGVGLSIIKRLCELLDASLELISSGDTGTTFRVVFPLTYSSKPTPPPPQANPA